MLEPATTGPFMLLAGCRKTDSAFHGVTSLSSEEHVPLQDGAICTRNHKSILLKRGGEVLAFFQDYNQLQPGLEIQRSGVCNAPDGWEPGCPLPGCPLQSKG